MRPLRQSMIDAMVLRGFSPRTQESYIGAIYGMAKHYRRDPAGYTVQEVDAEVELAWDEEIKPRIAEIDSGTAKLVPAEEVFAEVRRLLK